MNGNSKRGRTENQGAAVLWFVLGGGAMLVVVLVLGAAAVGGYFLLSRDRTKKDDMPARTRKDDAPADIPLHAGKPRMEVNLENYNKVKSGMSEAELTAILGSPTRMDPPPETSTGIDKILVWESGGDSVKIQVSSGKALMITGVVGGKICVGFYTPAADTAPPLNRDVANMPDRDPTQEPAPGGKTASGVTKNLNKEMVKKLGTKGHNTEAEIIAFVGTGPRRLGPQKMNKGGMSTDTLEWTDGDRTVLKVHILNGEYAGFVATNLPDAPSSGPPSSSKHIVFTVEDPPYVRIRQGMKEADIIALVGLTPKKLGPQPYYSGKIIMGDVREMVTSQETLEFTDEKNAKLLIWIENGRCARKEIRH